MSYKDLSKEQLMEERERLQREYNAKCAKGLNLDMSRGKPDTAQLDLSMGMMDALDGHDLIGEQGTDCRNYGVLDGIVEAKRLLSQMIECPIEDIIIYGNSSLNVMYDTVSRSMTHGVCGSTPWMKLSGPVKFLCPVPGYDRHFAITECFGIEMINIPMDENGPDMDMVEEYVSKDPMVKGIWCVPKYSNPGGVTYSDEVVKRFAALKPEAEDFRIYWDNAYCIHHLYDTPDKQDHILEILDECAKAGNPDIVFKFCSTSKVTFPGSGIAAIASSPKNIEFIKSNLTIQTIGHDKVNQLRHVKFFGDFNGMIEHMKKHAAILRPKFMTVLDILDTEIKPLDIAKWSKPLGGYFISLDTMDGCAKRVVKLCADAGVKMTGAGATYPYGKDPRDANIRIAPTYPTPDELKEACEVFAICLKLASVEKLIENK